MNIFKFEIKKILRQKKLIWLILSVLIWVGWLYWGNSIDNEQKAERAREHVDSLHEETNHVQANLREIENADEVHSLQEQNIRDMQSALVEWKTAIYYEEWDEIPLHEGEFLNNLQEYQNNGGEFMILQDSEKEIALKKNEWLVKHNLAYEDEAAPVSPHLILIDSSTALLSFLGILILSLLFGDTLAREKEQRTWLLLRSQPIAYWKIVSSKYISVLLLIGIYIGSVWLIGVGVPLLLGPHSLELQYPYILIVNETIHILSISDYFIRLSVVFFCASAFTFAIIFLVSKFVRDSFYALLLVGFIISLGYLLTEMNTFFQSVYNPFNYFRTADTAGDLIHNEGMWFYLLVALAWYALLISLNLLIPNKQNPFTSVEKKPFNEITSKYILWKMVNFEWRKIKRRGLFKQCMLLLVVFIVIGYTYQTKLAEDNESGYINLLEERAHVLENEYIPFTEEYLSSMEEMVEEMPADMQDEYRDTMISGEEKTLEFYNNRLQNINRALSAYKKEAWGPFIEYQLFENRYVNNEFDTHIIDLTLELLGQFTVDVSIAEKEWLIDNDIKPVFSGEFRPTIYHNFGNQITEKNQWLEENKKVDNSGLYILYSYFDNYAYAIPFILFLFLFGGGLADEHGKRKTLHYLKTQPVKVKDIVFGKYLTSTMVSIMSSLSLFIIVIITGGVFNRIGDWKYPILKYDPPSMVNNVNYTGMEPESGRGFHFINLGEYLIASVVIYTLLIVFFLGLCLLLSLFFKKKLNVFSIAIFIAAAGYILSLHWFGDVSHLSPFTYLNIPKILNGELPTALDNPNFHLYSGIIPLLGWSLLLLIIGYVSTRRNR
ncbi:ABC transporter permease subunit [Evansella clarkii]|uniref:ABC transporter permease subunit n=1 Tax=Evansella clarkii TaxID=79879 RepID=UPI00099799BB|nr:ABC transporter permease subunit [Evansella clarkii]